MSAPVSVVIPSLDDPGLLDACLAALLPELARRGAGDEVVVVDDGTGALAAHLADRDAALRVLELPANVGFARALLAGAEAARHDLLLALNPDVVVRPGFLEPLVETLERDPGTALVAPCVLHGEAASPGEETLPELVFEGGMHRVRPSALEVTPGEAHPDHPGGVPAGFALGGAMLARRAELLAEPFDRRYEPFYWEDVDLAERARAAGRRVLVDPRSVVVHLGRGTIGARVPEVLVRAAIERNRLLFTWKHERDPARLAAHFEALAARLVEHALDGEREELLWLLLALERDAGAGA
jgi:GT2 family glycosyltransferase